MICSVNHFSLIVHQHQILHDISFTLDSDKLTILKGHNGSGKSVLLQSMAALHRPLPPQIQWHIDNFTIHDIGYLPQKPYLLRRKVVAHLDFVQKAMQKNSDIDAILEQCHLKNIKDKNAYLLSGGQRQLLAFAMLLTAQPKILLLDEPTANLDPNHTKMIETMIKQQQSLGIKIILASHDEQQIKRLGDDILTLEHGYLKSS